MHQQILNVLNIVSVVRISLIAAFIAAISTAAEIIIYSLEPFPLHKRLPHTSLPSLWVKSSVRRFALHDQASEVISRDRNS